MYPIEAIKFIRRLLNLPLKEAKDLYHEKVESVWDKRNEDNEELTELDILIAIGHASRIANIHDYRGLRQAYHSRQWR